MATDPFVYIPPTEITAPKYAEIRDATNRAMDACRKAIEAAYLLACGDGTAEAWQPLFGSVGVATKELHDLIARTCPASADTSAALRCVRLARMAANEAITSERAYNSADSRENLRRCGDRLIEARWQACAAIALAQEN